MESATKNRFAKELASIEQHMGREGQKIFDFLANSKKSIHQYSTIQSLAE
jgi:hypothetical protein